ncbi:MAG TPA: HAMP domain-containing sensor histidine kinase [Pirellulaceae bacterium]|nr:HAMP domain-containing sensor histidine kinase [Pirellulaceae bacterium]
MRYPLRRQLLLPLLAILAVTLVLVTAAHAWLTTQALQQALDERMRDVARTLAQGNFPLERNVLRQAQGLSGAELVITNPAGELLAASDPAFQPPATSSQVQPPATLAMRELVAVGSQQYFFAKVALDRRAAGGQAQVLHLFYPERTYREALWAAIYPSLVVGAVLLGITALLASVIAARVTQPIASLEAQVARIAQGDFAPVELPRRDDELRELTQAVNHMAELLKANAAQIRQHERVATLHQLGSGIAHQLRNAATGCRMALDLFRREKPALQNDENLQIAARQLGLMEHYLQRFLMLGRTMRIERTPVDLCQLTTSALALVRPLAEHLHVTLESTIHPQPVILQGEATSLEQLLVNLLTNAIEACAAPGVAAPGVRIALDAQTPSITIADNGPGIASHIAARLGEPFVTSKPEGTGLGIAVAKEIVAQHDGTLRWERAGAWTQFVVNFASYQPAASARDLLITPV